METSCTPHATHTHTHAPGCGHLAIEHDGHTDYLHDGHMHHVHRDHVDEHRLEVTPANPADCTGGHACPTHDSGHVHGPDCGHLAIPHGDHVDYLVGGHLHHPHADHCDDHGAMMVI